MMRLHTLIEEMLAAAVALPPEEVNWKEAGIGQLLGRHLDAPIHAAFDLPPVDVSAMDGWAVRSGDLVAAKIGRAHV